MPRTVRLLLTFVALSQVPAVDPAAVTRAIAAALGDAATARAGLGASIPLHPVTKHTRCRVRGPLPDRDCTSGTRYRLVDRARVCTPGYAGRVRDVPQSRKDAVYHAYGMKRHFNGRNGEVDHLVSLELGGTNATANLFPEAASPTPGSHEKDRLENRLHDLVCSGQISLRRAQRAIAGDWVRAYRAYVLPT
jgi:hypothetical protein